MGGIERVTAPPVMPPRAVDLHKGSAGRVLVAAGSLTYPGAAVLAARGAGRGGAGLVTVACPEPARPLVAAHIVCEMSTPVAAEPSGGFAAAAAEALLSMSRERDVVVAGPGVGRADETLACMRRLALECGCATVLDADALAAFAGRSRDLREAQGPRVLTPHPGEAARLLGAIVGPIPAQRESAGLALAVESGQVVVLKGAATIVTDGERLYVNETGNRGMATGGTGDVLAGLLGALLATSLAPFEAATLAVHVHGRAGDLAAAEVGERGMVATDLLERVPRALAERETGTAR